LRLLPASGQIQIIPYMQFLNELWSGQIIR